MAKSVKKNPHPTRGNGLPPVTPQQVDRVRRSVLDVVRNNIPDVRLVLDGTKKWDNQQVRLFGMMLNKVMPDLHHSFNEHTVETKNMDELTIEELQEIAKQAETLEGEYEDASHTSGSGKEIATNTRNETELPRIREGTSTSV
jgi:hypothetical protein